MSKKDKSVVDVDKNFDLIILLLFIATCIDILREMLALCINHERGKMKWVINILKLNILFSIANIIILNYFRLSHSGRVCSGDYKLESDPKELYIEKRGLFLLVVLIIEWALIFLVGVGIGITFLYSRNKNKSKRTVAR